MGSLKGTKVPRADVGSARGSQTNAANADTFAELLRSVFNELKDLSATAAAQELTRQGPRRAAVHGQPLRSSTSVSG